MFLVIMLAVCFGAVCDALRFQQPLVWSEENYPYHIGSGSGFLYFHREPRRHTYCDESVYNLFPSTSERACDILRNLLL